MFRPFYAFVQGESGTDNESTSTENEKREETVVKADLNTANKQERRESILEKLISDVSFLYVFSFWLNN